MNYETISGVVSASLLTALAKIVPILFILCVLVVSNKIFLQSLENSKHHGTQRRKIISKAVENLSVARFIEEVYTSWVTKRNTELNSKLKPNS